MLASPKPIASAESRLLRRIIELSGLPSLMPCVMNDGTLDGLSAPDCGGGSIMFALACMLIRSTLPMRKRRVNVVVKGKIVRVSIRWDGRLHVRI